jgi:hypothetical protein
VAAEMLPAASPRISRDRITTFGCTRLVSKAPHRVSFDKGLRIVRRGRRGCAAAASGASGNTGSVIGDIKASGITSVCKIAQELDA